MRIKLDDKHYLNSDQYCFWVTCEYTNKKGTIAEKLVSGYCNTFCDVVDSYIKKKIGGSDAETIERLSQDIENLKEEIRGWENVVSRK